MAEVLLFHHALGCTPGVIALADRLRSAGHDVHVPDLYDGRTFPDVEAGVAHAEQIGFGNLLEQAGRFAEALPEQLVYAGISLGVLPAQQLAQTRPGAAGAVLMEACVPPTEFSDGWPPHVPVQVHGMEGDEFFVGEGDLDVARELVASTSEAELFLYPGDGHLFTDPATPSFDPAATDLLVERVLEFLAAR